MPVPGIVYFRIGYMTVFIVNKNERFVLILNGCFLNTVLKRLWEQICFLR